jgi:RNA polymerase sigma-70 factor (ECF subfamily)
MEDIDIALMLSVKEDDSSSFEQLLSKHQKGVFNLVYRYVGDSFLAEDLTQEVFFRVYRARKSYTPQAKFTTWLYKIVTNVCFKALKARKRVYSLDYKPNNSDVSITQNIQSSPSDPSDAMEKEEVSKRVKDVIDNLPPNQRMAVILNKYEGLSYEDIGISMGIKANAVKSLMSRARENIKDKLGAYVDKNL